jgi:hypothetical protein
MERRISLDAMRAHCTKVGALFYIKMEISDLNASKYV